jgi:hypothetical protein
VWASSAAAVATIAPTGIATGLTAGSTTITATAGAVSGKATLTVTSATLVSIALNPTNPVAGIGVAVAFTATGTFSDGSISDLSTEATWTSSATNVASIDGSTQQAKTLAPGSTTITATVGGVSGSTLLTVTAATLTGITVAPATSTVAVNGTLSLTATGTYSDNTTADLTATATWASDGATVASVSNAPGSQGVVTGLAGGTATITATFGGVSGKASITVSAAALASMAITPANPQVPKSTSVQLSATGTYSDGSVIDVTTSASWSSDDATIATVSNAPGSQGNVIGVALGTTSVHASLGAVSASTTITVTSAVLQSITLSPAQPNITAGNKQAMTATGVYSDGSSADVTTSAVWRIGDSAVATVSNASGSQGVITAVAAGTTTVSATLNGITGQTTVTVGPPALTQIVVSPIADSVRLGTNVTYTATAIFANNTQQNVTGQATWTSSDTTVATLARRGGMGGGPGGGGGAEVATTVGAGTTTISAQFMGVTGTTTLAVTTATLVEVTITPIAPTLAVNGTLAFAATAIYSDNSSQNVTAQATWQSSNPMVAAITTGGGGGPGGRGGRGNATGLAAGTTQISATFQGVTGTTTLTVTAATLVSISVNPPAVSGGVGTQQQFTAQAIYSDQTSRDITGQATWVSSAPAVVGVSDAVGGPGGGGGGRGLAKALAQGTATISASFGGVTGTATFTVTAATLTQIQITPFVPRLPVGFNVQLTATAIYSDNTTKDVTALATWSSSTPATASVSDAGNGKGQLSPLAAGTTTITASYQSVSGTDTVTVTSATLTALTVTPATASAAAFAVQPFTATGTLSDATTIDATSYVTWLSSQPSIASISNAAGSRGVATGLSSGTVTITAVRGTVSGTASFTVN